MCAWMPKTHEQLTRPRQSQRDYDRRRKDTETDGFTNDPRWRRLRLVVLSEEPVCRCCQRELSTDVDHIKPRRTHPELAWDRSNLQGLCRSCHSEKTRRGE